MQTSPGSDYRPESNPISERTADESGPRSHVAWTWAQRLCIVIPILYFLLGFAWDQAQPPVPYFVSEWMTSYAGGFVRRGLPGQIFLSGSDILHLNAIDLIKCVRAALAFLYLAVLGFGVLKNSRNLGLVGSLTILLSPLVAICGWADFGSIDLLFILTCALNAALAARLDKDAYARAACIWIGLAGVVLGFSHEGFLLVCLPLNLVISGNKLGANNWKRVAAIYAAPIAVCLVAMKFNGTPHQAELIRIAWLDHNVDLPANSAVSYLGKTVPQEIGFIHHYMTPDHIGECLAALVACLASVAVLYTWLPIKSAEKNKILVGYFAIPILITLPLYFIGSDWHRWVQIPFASGILALLFSNHLQAPLKLSRPQLSLLIALIFLGTWVKPAAPYFPAKNVFTGGSLPESIELIKNLILYQTIKTPNG